MMRQILYFIFIFTAIIAKSQTFEVESVEFTFKVQEWEAINSKYSDFSAVLNGNRIVFTTDRNIEKVNIGENNWKKGSHYNIYTYEISGDQIIGAKLEKPSLFSEKFTSNSHTGPICFSETGDTIFFSRVEKSKLKGKKGKFNFKPQLYMVFKEKKGFGKLQKLNINQKGYSFSHPSYDSESKTLYFAADIEEGSGEGDIYRSKMDSSGNFSVLENLGDQINTSGNEMFPFFYKGELYFSSNKKGGEGNLDIYWSYEKEGIWKESMNLGKTINTQEDDFGINIYADLTRGFISSNIEGNDDIYYFDVEKKVTITNELSGSFSYRNLDTDVSGIRTQVTSDDLDMVFESMSDEEGRFNLKELPSGLKYQIHVINNNEEDLMVSFYDENGNIISQMIINGNGNFEYKKLHSDKSLLAVVDTEDDFDMNTHYTGKIVSSQNTIPDKKLEIFLVDENGNTIKITETDQFGNFTFKEIDYNSNSRFKIQNPEDEYSMFIFNSDGEVVSKLRIDENGVFNYRKLKTEGTDLNLIVTEEYDFEFSRKWITAELKDSKGNKVVGEDIKVEVYNQDNKLISESKMKEAGEFVFSELSMEDVYLFKTDYKENENLSFWLYDYKGNKIAVLTRNKETGFFIFKVLDNENSNIASENYDENFDFNFNGTDNTDNKENKEVKEHETKENTDHVEVKEVNEVKEVKIEGDKNMIYFDVNSSYMSEGEKAKLKSLSTELKSSSAKVYIEGHTDINGDDEYNIWLSERRTNRVFNYLIELGISKSRLEIGHFGEKQPEKKCPSGNCGDDIHKQNRRVSLVVK